MRNQSRSALLAGLVSLLGASLVVLIINHASLKAEVDDSTLGLYSLEQQGDKARFQELWFGPGISDDLNRLVKMGQLMSPKLVSNLAKGLKEQSKMVHLDSYHQGEAGAATAEADLWSSYGGNNNGGNEPCMKDPGQCP